MTEALSFRSFNAMIQARREEDQLASRYGFALVRAGKHRVFRNAEGAQVVASATPRSQHHRRRFESELRRQATRTASNAPL